VDRVAKGERAYCYRHLLVLLLSSAVRDVDVAQRFFGRRKRARLGNCDRVVHLSLGVLADASHIVLGQQAALTCLLRNGRRWVVLPIGCRLLRGSVCDLVALEVAKVAPGPGLYQGWSFPPPGPSDGLAGGLVDGDHVVAINCDARDVVGGGAVCDARRRAVVADRRGFSELVGLTDEEHRQLPDCGQVHRLVCRALLGRTVTEEA